MFDGKLKAVTFSYDDAVTQDIRFIQLLDKYNPEQFELYSLERQNKEMVYPPKVKVKKQNNMKSNIKIQFYRVL